MIRKITPILAVICLIFTSCTTDIEINDPALQTKIDGEIFRSSIKKATIYDDGTMIISGSNGDKSISFTITSTKTGTYKLAQNTVNKVSFLKNQSKFISKEGETQGTVQVSEIYNNEISGNFQFKNLKDDKGNVMNFSDGWFYKIPIENGVIEEPQIEEINPCLLNASLTAMVDGNEMITDDHKAELFGVENASILITATNEEGEISIVFPSNVTAGEYSLTGSGAYSATYTTGKDKSSVLSGKLTITEHDIDTKCINGNFEFETRSGNQISEGFFDFGY